MPYFARQKQCSQKSIQTVRVKNNLCTSGINRDMAHNFDVPAPMVIMKATELDNFERPGHTREVIPKRYISNKEQHCTYVYYLKSNSPISVSGTTQFSILPLLQCLGDGL